MSDWTFEDPSLDFDSHVREQLPWYDVATAMILDIATHFATPQSIVYDLGAATGNIGRTLNDLIEEREIDFRPIEPVASLGYNGPGTVIPLKASEVSYAPFSVAVSMLTLIFMSVAERALVLRSLAEQVVPGGCLILVERFDPPSGYLGLVNARTTLFRKLDAGADPADVMLKERALAGIQRPLSFAEIEPYNPVEFFRAADFAGYILGA